MARLTMTDWTLSVRSGPGTLALVDDQGHAVRIADADLGRLLDAVQAHRSHVAADPRTIIPGSDAARRAARKAQTNRTGR